MQYEGAVSKPSNIFVKNFNRLYDATGWSQKEMAKRAGTTQGNVSLYLAGDRVPGLDIVERIAAAFGVSVLEILTDPNQSQIKPRIVEPTPTEALEIVARALRESQKMPAAKRDRIPLIKALEECSDEEFDQAVAALKAILRGRRLDLGAAREPSKRDE